MSLQSITFPDAAYERAATRRELDPDLHLPGRPVPSLAVIERSLTRTDLLIRSVDDIATDYVRTLRSWRARFLGAARRGPRDGLRRALHPDVGVLPRDAARPASRPASARTCRSCSRSGAASPSLSRPATWRAPRTNRACRPLMPTGSRTSTTVVRPVPLAEDHQDLREHRVDAHPLPDPRVLPWEHDLLDPAHGRIEVGDDLLTADHEDHATGARRVGAELAAVAEAATSVPSSVIAATLPSMKSGVATSFRISRPWVARSIVTSRGRMASYRPDSDELRVEADVLERLRLARVHLGARRDQAEDDVLGLGARVDDDRLDVVRAEHLRDVAEAVR